MKKVATRRTFVGGALVVGAGAFLGGNVALSTPVALADDGALEAPDVPEDPSDPTTPARLGFWIDTRRCVGCGDCVEACKKANHTPEDLKPRREVRDYITEWGEKLHISTSCMHCQDAACEKVCPAHAIVKRADGIVALDKSRCMGCKYCYQACPFEVPQYNHDGMDKCDCCLSAGITPGDKPNCVLACGKGALRFGDVTTMQELAGEAAQLIVAPTNPSCLVS